MRVAAVDLGTNSTRLLVADVDGERLQEVVPATDDHAARRRSRRETTPAARPDRARPQLPRRLPPRARGARSRAHALHCDERRAGRGERRGVPGRDRVELRLHDAASGRQRGGGDDGPRRLRGTTLARGHADRGHRRRLDRAGRHLERCCSDGVGQPRRRLRAPDRAVPGVGSPVEARARNRRSIRSLAASVPTTPRVRSASPAPSRRWRRSISGSTSTTRSEPTGTASLATRSNASSSGSRR